MYTWVESELVHWMETPTSNDVHMCVVLRRLLPAGECTDGCVMIPPFVATGFKVEHLRAPDKAEIQRLIGKGWRFEGDHDEVLALLQS